MRERRKKLRQQYRAPRELWLYFTWVIFATIFVIFLFVSLLWALVSYIKAGTIDVGARRAPILFFLFGSILLGLVVTASVGRLIIRPMREFGRAFDEIARGDFDYRVPVTAKFDEINRMAERLNAMTYDLAHIETLRSDFVANVSHEFKTPLAAIEGYATLLQNHALPQEKREYYIGKILENTRRLTGLSSDVLALSKLENQGEIVDRQEFRLDEQIRKAVIVLEDKWSAKGIEFDMELPKQMYEGSASLLSQVWVNILDNAVKCSPEGSVIHIGLAQTEAGIVVSIQDHGIGMSPEVCKHIFEKFYQGDPSRQTEGNGLGLALVARILELCHGTIAVESKEGEGTTFRVTL